MAEVVIVWKGRKKYQNRNVLETALKRNKIPDSWPYFVVTEPGSNMVAPVFVVDNKHMPGMLRVVHCGYYLVGG